MSVLTRTIYGAASQTHLVLGLPMEYLPHTTLNEKFNIFPNTKPLANEPQVLGYWVIGNGGHKCTHGPGGIPLSEPVQHLATDAACFSHIPFAAREINNDFTPAQRAHLCLRRVETHQNRSWAVYYGRRFPRTGIRVDLYSMIVDNGIPQPPTQFVPDSTNLNPTPMDLSNVGVNIIEGRYVAATTRVNLTLEQADLEEFKNAAKVVLGDERLAIISEVGFCFGRDRQVQVPNPGGGTLSYQEVLGCQLGIFLNTNYPASTANSRINITAEIGSQEPLFKQTTFLSAPGTGGGGNGGIPGGGNTVTP